jgi:dTDP-4-amino-4,6-dideoxygalactose transaminase
MRALETVAARHNLAIVEDACQAHLATCAGRRVGGIGVAGAFSFYPTKNLGALGDGGAVATNDAQLADRVRRLRNGGQTSRYHHAEPGVNSRLDELQAAVLRARLPYLPGWIAQRRHLAALYRRELEGTVVTVPPLLDEGHVFHLFPVLSRQRAELQQHLSREGIETLVHYPRSIARQPAFAATNAAACPLADRVCEQVVSLPLYPSLPERDATYVTSVVRTFQELGFQD